MTAALPSGTRPNEKVLERLVLLGRPKETASYSRRGTSCQGIDDRLEQRSERSREVLGHSNISTTEDVYSTFLRKLNVRPP